ncbi:TonB-dependent siderophore receptor [Achromobacter dolens]|uniref:TonB-dependent siderophore receptor n=1 Tax=Achromobacter dolens TaxID=1287738 RepID=UPI0014670D3D|nr:TonB-dependent receptor [Achromobacter dolens]CAB3667650.1 Metal-pseudopaline receptor CntO [Achromobacter dolens]
MHVPPFRFPLLARALATALTAPTVLLAVTPAQAQAPAGFQVAPGPLSQALSQFASQAGVTLSLDGRLVAGKQSPGLSGAYSVDQGFGRLLDGTGLRAERRPDNVYTVRPVASGDNAAQLEPVTVLGATTAEGAYQPEPVASVTRSPLAVLDQPQAVNVVPAQVLRDQRPRNLDDALANVSGITQGNTLAGTQDTLMKRGFGANRDGSIMHNGMPLVQGRGLNAAADSVEVLKGPASLLYGIMDPGGVINIVSKRPQLTPYHAITLTGSTYAQGRDGVGATLDSTGPIGDSRLAYRLVVDTMNEDYWRDFGRRRDTLVAPSLAWYGQDTQIVASYEHRDYLYPFDRGTALDPTTGKPLDIPSRRRLDEPYNNMWGSTELAQVTIDQRVTDNWKAHLGFSWNQERYDANQVRVTAIDPVAGTIKRSNDGTRGALSTDHYVIGYVDGRVDIGGLRNDLQVGADYERRKIFRSDLIRQNLSKPFSYVNPVYDQQDPGNTVVASDSDQTDKLRATSFFLQDSLHLGERWILVGGLRYQHYEQLAGRGRPFKTNTDIEGGKWLPRAGLVYKWTPEVSLYGSYTESLKPTSTIAPLTSGTVIDSGVAPEQAKSWELGLKWDMPGQTTGTLALFDIRKRNVLVSQYNDVTKLTDWRTSGAARSRGVELDVSGSLSARWDFMASYAYLDARTTDDPQYQGNRLWNVAQHTGSLALVYNAGQIGEGRLRLGTAARYVGTRPGDSANSFVLPAYTVVNAFATYDTRVAGRKVQFQLNVNNLFDRTYYTSSANQYFISMGDARQFVLSTRVEF